MPYVSHLLGAASIAIEQGASEDEAIAALLADAIEGQGGTAPRQEVRGRVGGTGAGAAPGGPAAGRARRRLRGPGAPGVQARA